MDTTKRMLRLVTDSERHDLFEDTRNVAEIYKSFKNNYYNKSKFHWLQREICKTKAYQFPTIRKYYKALLEIVTEANI